MAVISVSHLSKSFSVFDKKPGLGQAIKSLFSRQYRQVKAVDDISFSINRGELVGFIGPNGAGKTTTLKCLSGLLYPSSGQIDILGFTPQKRSYPFLSQIGFIMGQKNQLWWDIPPQETFLLHRAIYNIPPKEYQKRLDFFIDTLDIKDVIAVQTKKLSLGQRMKCEFVAALLHSPKVVFLDEPTIGLDVVASLKIRQFVKSYNQEFKSTIILTSHNMADVSELCSRIIVIDRGQLQYDGSLKSLLTQYSPGKRLNFTFDQPVAKKALSGFGQLIQFQPQQVTLSVSSSEAPTVVARILSSFSVNDLDIQETPIEDIIRQIFTQNHSD
jgi:ABC-2 type transport system ATP-binding protein